MKLITPSNSYKNFYEDNEPKQSIQIVLKSEMGETMTDKVPYDCLYMTIKPSTNELGTHDMVP